MQPISPKVAGMRKDLGRYLSLRVPAQYITYTRPPWLKKNAKHGRQGILLGSADC